MSWALQLVLAVLVVGVIAGVVIVVVGGHGDPMTEEYDDRPDVGVPRDRALTADDVREVRFTTALRGYRTSEVDALLERLAAQIGGRDTSSGTSAPDGLWAPRQPPEATQPADPERSERRDSPDEE